MAVPPEQRVAAPAAVVAVAAAVAAAAAAAAAAAVVAEAGTAAEGGSSSGWLQGSGGKAEGQDAGHCKVPFLARHRLRRPRPGDRGIRVGLPPPASGPWLAGTAAGGSDPGRSRAEDPGPGGGSAVVNEQLGEQRVALKPLGTGALDCWPHKDPGREAVAPAALARGSCWKLHRDCKEPYSRKELHKATAVHKVRCRGPAGVGPRPWPCCAWRPAWRDAGLEQCRAVGG